MPRIGWLVVVGLVAVTLWFAHVERRLVDFAVYRTAAERVMRAEPLYRPDDGHWQFKYLPASALILAPVAALPEGASRAAWYALLVAALVGFVRTCVRALPDKRRSDRALTWLAILVLGRFYVHELDLGQSNVLLGLVLIHAVAAAERRQTVLAGLLVGLAIFIKPYALILVPWLPIAAGWRTAGVTSAVLAGGLIVPAALYGWTGNVALHLEWYRTVTDTTASNLGYVENISWIAAWTRWVGPGPTATQLAAATSAAFVFGVGAALYWRARAARPIYLEYGLLMLGVALVSPQGWDYVLLVATAAVLTLANVFARLPVTWRLVTGASMAVVGFTIYDLLGRSLYVGAMGWAVVTVAATVLVAALIEVRRRGLA